MYFNGTTKNFKKCSQNFGQLGLSIAQKVFVQEIIKWYALDLKYILHKH